METLITLWENEPVLYNVSNPEYHVKEARRNAIMRIIGKIKERGIFPLPSLDDVIRKIIAMRSCFVAEKNKMEQSKIIGAESSGTYKSRWQFYESLLILADFISPHNIQLSLETFQQSNSERKTQIKAVSNRKKPSKNDGTNQNAQADISIKSGVEVFNALKHKANQSDQHRSQDFKFGDLNGSELEQIPPGPVKDMLKIDIQKLIYQTKHSDLQIASSSQSQQKFGMVRSFDSCNVTRSKSSTPISSNRGSQKRSFTIESSCNSFGY